MPSGRNRFEERVRDTLSSLSDNDLIRIIHAPREYTPFAIKEARRELADRRLNVTQLSPAIVDPSPKSSSQFSECYVEVWRDIGFAGEYLRIQGPGEYHSLIFDDKDWSDDVGSLRVGPHAFVEAFDALSFVGRMICFGPNQDVANLGDFAFDNEMESIRLIDSMKILCAPRDGPECNSEDATSKTAETLIKKKSNKNRKKQR